MFRTLLPLMGIPCLLLLSGCQKSAASDAPEVDELDPVSVTVFTPKVELFMEYPHLIRGEPARFLAHVTVLETGEPVRSGSLEFVVDTPGAAAVTLKAAAPARDGLFTPEGALHQSGSFPARIVVTSPQVDDVIPLEAIVVHEDVRAAADAALEATRPDPPDAVPFLLEQQWPLRTLIRPAARRTLVERLHVVGEVLARDGAAVRVTSPVAGRLTSPRSGLVPRIGDEVKAGQVLGHVEPPLPYTEATQLRANQLQAAATARELLLRRIDLQMKEIEILQSLEQARSRLDLARKAHERITGLHAKGLCTEGQRDECVANLRLAEAELEGAERLRESSEAAKAALASLLSEQPGARGGAHEPSGDAFLLDIVSPIDGVVEGKSHAPGEHVEVDDALFHIVARDTVSIRAPVSEFNLARLADSPGAVVRIPGEAGDGVDVLGDGMGRLVHKGGVVHPERRTVDLFYELPNPGGRLLIGRTVDVLLETRRAVDAVVVPEEAIVLENGLPTVYVLLQGELFQKRELETGARDRGFVEVKRGVAEGERVVIRGAYAIRVAGLNPESFSHGHVH